MKRREFIAGLGSAAALSLACWSHRSSAQQRTLTVGVLSAFDVPGNERIQALPPALLQALSESGFADGRNIAFEFRAASGQVDRLPALAADLARQRVDLIFTPGLPPALAAKAATATIPIVFTMGEDPVKDGVVASLGRPGRNVTGFTGFSNQLMAKRLELLHQAMPKATTIAFLVNPNSPNAGPDTADARAATVAHSLRLRVLAARSECDFEEAFATISKERIGALLVGVEPFFWLRREELAALAARHAVPAAYDRNIFPAVGGLMSYGTNAEEGDRIVGNYMGRILKGAKPAELPVMQATKFEFIINLKTAKALGLTIPETLLATADEVIQ